MTITAAPIDIPAEEEQRIRRLVREEQFSLIFRTNRNSNVVAISMALVLWMYMYFRLGNSWALVWGGAMHFTQLVRSFWVGRYFRDPSVVHDPGWVRGYLLRLGINGAIWGAAPLVMFDANDMAGLALVTVSVLAIHSGGQTWVAPVRGAILAFCLPIIVQLCIALALHDSATLRVAAVLAFLYLYLSMRFALQHNQMLADSLHAHFLNAALNARLSEQLAVVELASTEKSRFFAAASHDLRQPMHAIALFSAALEHDLRGTPQHESASRSLDAVRALSESLDAMLDVSKLDAGVVQVLEAGVPLQHVFQRLNALFAPQANEKGLHLRFRSTTAVVLTDERHLERMLANLVSNAIKYTARGGVLVAARPRGAGLAIEVWDTGMGVPAGQHERIFEEFFQLGNPGRDRSQGLGIGLAVVRRLSALLGLPVRLQSTPGRGSVFRIEVPAGKALAASTVPAAARLPAAAPVTPLALPSCVLVLDDEDDILAAVRSVLSGHRIEVLTASDCQQALALLQDPRWAGRIDAFLCDWRLGSGTSGLEFASSLGPEHGIHVATVMVTGETGPEALRQVRESGLPTVFKPVSAPRLLEALSSACRPQPA
ncbi:ATP-binding response regulator [Caenimonas sedimenti]|nr:hybrid sensor histidine kinase/response regulator [Caenimonas sedimenti]